MSGSSNAKTGTAVAIGVTALCALVTAGTEYAGALELRIGTFALVLLPLFFAFVITVAFSLSLSWRRPEAVAPIWSCAGQLLQLLTVVFVVRAGVVLGTSLPTIIEAGPAILVQSLGKRGPRCWPSRRPCCSASDARVSAPPSPSAANPASPW